MIFFCSFSKVVRSDFFKAEHREQHEQIFTPAKFNRPQPFWSRQKQLATFFQALIGRGDSIHFC